MAQPPTKKEVMLALLERTEARVHLDARRDGVVLPERLLGDGHVRLNYGYHFKPPIPDLLVDDDGVHATLSFDRRPFGTFVPWTSVYLIADFDGNGSVWQEDIPADLLDQMGELPGQAPKEIGAPVPVPAPAGKDAKKPRPSHLKLVK